MSLTGHSLVDLNDDNSFRLNPMEDHEVAKNPQLVGQEKSIDAVG